MVVMAMVVVMRADVGFVVNDRRVVSRVMRGRIRSGPAAAKGHVHAHEGRRIVAVVVVQSGRQWQRQMVVVVMMATPAAASPR